MISDDDIKKLAELGRLSVSEEECGTLAAEIGTILEYISEIQNVHPEVPEKKPGALRNVMRDDESPHESGVYTETLLSLAPRRSGQHIAVRKVIDQTS